MVPSQACISLIKLYEGCKLQAYQDQKGIWSIGYGCTGYGIQQGTIWTQAQADQQLAQRVAAFASQVTAAVGLKANQNQFDALVSLCYNIGPQALRGSTLVRFINQRDYADAAKEFLKWDHAGPAVDPGLLRRRQAEQKLFLTPSK